VVEDEDAVRSLICHTLRKSGYKILEAANGLRAMEVSQNHSDPIHLLLTDTVMPHMSGSQLAQLMVKARPTLRVLYVSGYTDDSIIRHGVMRESTAFLQKPFSNHVLVSTVREVLNQGVASRTK
jgi:DNA-binding NtrC family response regulator